MNGSNNTQLVVFHPYAAALERILWHHIPDLILHAGTELETVNTYLADATILWRQPSSHR